MDRAAEERQRAGGGGKEGASVSVWRRPLRPALLPLEAAGAEEAGAGGGGGGEGAEGR